MTGIRVRLLLAPNLEDMLQDVPHRLDLVIRGWRHINGSEPVPYLFGRGNVYGYSFYP